MAVKESKNGTGHINRIASEVEKVAVIQPLRIGKLSFKLKGTSTLVTHPLGEKARKEMLQKQTGTKKTTKHAPRCPMQEFLDSFYWIDQTPPRPKKVVDDVPIYDEDEVWEVVNKAKFGIPITGFKNALISACRNQDMKMTQMRQACFVSGTEHPDWAIIEGKPEWRADICRIQKKIPHEVFRPGWNEWSTSIRIEWDLNVLNEHQIANLLSVAGYYVGICEGRPEKSALGWGRWEIA